MEKKMIVNSLVLGGTLLLAVSCGNDDKKKAGTLPMTPQAARAPEKGVFRASLRSINQNVAGNINGTATITINNGEFYVQMDINNTPANIAHAQYIHALENCPTEDNDLNKDGYIDAVEAGSTYGQYLIPLDGDLKTQAMETPMFPVADRNGSYVYRDWANIDELMADLRSRDVSPGMVKLGEAETLNLGKRSVVIYGVSADTELPETVATTPNANKHVTFPIACGSIVKISDDVIKF